ncbi:6025_t:CDS:2 [Dentiscutata erythropus]|uniref:6025_t:CDS:1 n=1 Tax=Dentiscutata erythropus TaxID=1348616 RepID=A0A9N9I4F6_9GLOM|nr:6025_t:CDS:2 [Dentiscutata erythropus]
MEYRQPCKECIKEEKFWTTENIRIKEILKVGENQQEDKIENEDEMIIDIETEEERENKELRNQMKEEKEETERLINIKLNENVNLAQRVMEVGMENEKLNRKIEEYEMVEKVICDKNESIFHCENCKEEGTNYIYYPQSSINMYKTLYLAEQEISKKRVEELKEFNNLFNSYQTLEMEKKDEIIFREQQTIEEILSEFNTVINYERTKNNN